MPFKAKNNREAVVVCAIHVVKRPSIFDNTKSGQPDIQAYSREIQPSLAEFED